jgi:hypothetical protein
VRHRHRGVNNNATVTAPSSTPPYVSFAWNGSTLGSPWLQYPTRGTTLSPPIVFHPAGTPNTEAALQTTSNSAGATGNVSGNNEISSVWLEPEDAHAGYGTNGPQDGQSTWYHAKVEFPHGADCFNSNGRPNPSETKNDCYFPTTGQWNWAYEWHIDGHTESYSSNTNSMTFGVYTSYPVVNGAVGRRPHLVFRLSGGNSSSPTYQNVELSAPLLYNHWYDVLFHFVWSANSSVGLAEWWLDGVREVSKHFPTLYTNRDGSHSYNNFGIYNYRLAAPWNSTIYFDQVAAGPTQASVGG